MTTDFYILIIISMAGLGIIIVGFILLQVRNQKKLLEKQKQIAAAEIKHQKTLLEAVITSQETERQRIGNDLHDEVGSVLSSLRMLIEKNNTNKSSLTSELFVNRSKEMIDNVIKKTRQISHNLSPHIGGDLCLFDVLHELCDTVNSSGNIAIHTLFDETSFPAGIKENTTVALYRVFAELINNTIKHAQADSIHIEINTNNGVMHIHYSDNGIGLVPGKHRMETKGMGLQNIESRLNMIHANWKIQENGPKGFGISINVPINEY